MEENTFKLNGLKEVMEALESLPNELQAKILKSFMSKAGREYIVKPLRSKLNYSQETESSLKVISNPANKLSVMAGVTTKGYKLNWADKGTKVRTTKKGQNRGQIVGKNQVQPHIESSIEPIVDYTNEEMGNFIDKVLEKKLKKLK